ncbi:MAG: hypothetical protein IT158_30530 [Bryobacterales bacterium]|nr:hypothetical protein [Bryobacterales bacterium]
MPRKRRALLLIAGVLTLYAAVAAVLLRLMPGSPTPTDYFVTGSVATFVSLLAVFLILLLSWFGKPDGKR